MSRATMGFLALTLLLGLWICGAGADEVSAKFYTERGAKLLGSGDYGPARKQFEKALAEMGGYAPALLGLAQVAVKEGHPAQAVPWLETCLDQGEKDGLSKDEKSAVAKARKLFNKVDRPRLELRDILKSFESKLLAIATRYEKKDPALARRCLKRILEVCPEHPEALKRLKGVAPAAMAPLGSLGGNAKEIFNRKDFDGWSINPAIWAVVNGCMVGTPGADSFTIRRNQRLDQNFTMELELRAPDGISKGQLIGVIFGDGRPVSYAFVHLDRDFAIIRHEGPTMKIRKRVQFSEVSAGFVPSEWHTLRLEVDGPTLKASINGDEVFDFDGGAEDAFEGYVGFWAQRARLEVRRVSLAD